LRKLHTSLKTLFLDYNNIHDAGAFAFAANTTLEGLSIGTNKISAAGIDALRNSTTLKWLSVDGNESDSVQLHKAKTLTNKYAISTKERCTQHHNILCLKMLDKQA
jgi:hypothetical protein